MTNKTENSIELTPVDFKYDSQIRLDSYIDTSVSGKWGSAPPEGIRSGVRKFHNNEPEEFTKQIFEYVKQNNQIHRVSGYNPGLRCDVFSLNERSLRTLQGVIQRTLMEIARNPNAMVIMDNVDRSWFK